MPVTRRSRVTGMSHTSLWHELGLVIPHEHLGGYLVNLTTTISGFTSFSNIIRVYIIENNKIPTNQFLWGINSPNQTRMRVRYGYLLITLSQKFFFLSWLSSALLIIDIFPLCGPSPLPQWRDHAQICCPPPSSTSALTPILIWLSSACFFL